MIGSGALPPPNPDVPCCEAAAYSGGEDCTCWTAILAPSPDDDAAQAGPHPLRRLMCGDCAYRPDSPERLDAGGDLPPGTRDRPFYCHDGMPRAVGYTHPEVPGVGIRADAFDSLAGDYQPLQRAGRPYQADGSPAVLCAGWAAHVRARHP